MAQEPRFSIHDCGVMVRPCPRTECRYHLGASERVRGPQARRPVERDLSDTCALDVAERGPETLDQVGRRMGLCRERVRQIENRALYKIRLLGERPWVT